MIKFFRHIRQRMLKENRFSRYFLYAIGEIVLVVIGILIALQVNDWNEQQANRAREVKYLTGLKADFAVDRNNLTDFIEDKERKATSAWLLLNSPPPKTAVEIQRLDSLSWNVNLWKTFVPSTKTLDELIGSGNLSFITNDSIKSMMLDVVQQYEDLDVHTAHMRREYDMYLYDRTVFLKEQFTFTDWENFLATNTVSFRVDASEARLAILEQQWTTLLQDLAYRNGLKLAMLNNQLMHQRSGETIHEIERTIALIEQEIKETE